jgi:hypothetical protein
LLNLWNTKTLSDVTLNCKNKNIKAHTLILASGIISSRSISSNISNNSRENKFFSSSSSSIPHDGADQVQPFNWPDKRVPDNWTAIVLHQFTGRVVPVAGGVSVFCNSHQRIA